MTSPFFAGFQVSVRRSGERRRKGTGPAVCARNNESCPASCCPGANRFHVLCTPGLSVRPGRYPRPDLCVRLRAAVGIRAGDSVPVRTLRAVSAPGLLCLPAHPGRYPRPDLCVRLRAAVGIRAGAFVSVRTLRAVSAPGPLCLPAHSGRYLRRGLCVCPRTPGGICAGAFVSARALRAVFASGLLYLPVYSGLYPRPDLCVGLYTPEYRARFRLPRPHPGRKTTLLLCGMRCRKTAGRRAPFRQPLSEAMCRFYPFWEFSGTGTAGGCGARFCLSTGDPGRSEGFPARRRGREALPSRVGF